MDIAVDPRVIGAVVENGIGDDGWNTPQPLGSGGIRNGLVKLAQGRFGGEFVTEFRLIEKEPLYVLVGPQAGPKRQVRTRRLSSLEKHAAKELRWEICRVEKARLKEVGRVKAAAEWQLAIILARRDIEVEARGVLQQYTVPGVTNVVEIQSMLLQLIGGMAADEAQVRALPQV